MSFFFGYIDLFLYLYVKKLFKKLSNFVLIDINCSKRTSMNVSAILVSMETARIRWTTLHALVRLDTVETHAMVRLTCAILILKWRVFFWCEHITYSSENIDGCLSNPCQNGGVCNDGVNSYTCSCVSVYGGDHCESM